MYVIKRTKDFERSIERLRHRGIKVSLRKHIEHTIDLLASGGKLSIAHRDHKLVGELAEYRECHIQGDLLLIYAKDDMRHILVLVDIGTHSQLFG